MKKIAFLSIFLSVLSFSDNAVIKESDFCLNEVIQEPKTFSSTNHEDTKTFLYLRNKYETKEIELDLNKFKDKIVFSYGNGKKNYFIFADPECKYCRAFAKDSLEHLNDATYHVILLPLKKHKKSDKMISFILDGKNNTERFKRFKSVLIDEKFMADSFIPSDKETKNYIDSITELIKQYNISSTPSFVKIEKNKIKKISWQDYNDEVN